MPITTGRRHARASAVRTWLFVAPRARRRIPKLPRALAAGGAVGVVGAGLLGLGHQRFGLVLIGAGLVLVLAQIALDDVAPPAR